MTADKISSIVDTSFEQAFQNWTKQIGNELYPSAFADEYSWLHVKNALNLNNALLKEAIKQSLTEILSEM